MTTTLPYFVYDAAFNNYRMGQASAAAILMLCILLVLLVTYLVLIKKVEKKS